MIKVALIIILLITWFGESILPGWVRLAHQYKIQALADGQTIETPQGVWVRLKDDFIKIGMIESNHRLKDLKQFHFNQQHKLVYARHIGELVEQSAHQWQAYNVVETQIFAHHTKNYTYAQLKWDVPLSWDVLGVGQRQVDEMTLFELYKVLHTQQANILFGEHEWLVYHQRLVQPFTTLVMMLLAIPFIFGPLRSSTMGSKLLIGAAVGFSFYIVNRFLGSASQVYQWPTLLSAVAPTVICALFGFWLYSRAL